MTLYYDCNVPPIHLLPEVKWWTG